MLVTFDEINQPWLSAARWLQQPVDPAGLRLSSEHPLLAGLETNQVQWHAHGSFELPAGGVPLITDASGNGVLYLDERSYAPGRLLAGTLDPDCHAGYGSDLPRPLLRAILRWVLAAPTPAVAPAFA